MQTVSACKYTDLDVFIFHTSNCNWIEKISLVDKKTNEEILNMVQEDQNNYIKHDVVS